MGALASGWLRDEFEVNEAVLCETLPEDLTFPAAFTGEGLIGWGTEPGIAFKRVLGTVREAYLKGQMRSKPDGLRLVAELRGKSRLRSPCR